VAFRQTEAHARAGRRAEALAEARAALHGKSRDVVDGDPALSAVMDLAMRTLLASPVSAETMEVLESLGRPRERLARAEAFAQAALAAGAPESAMATFLWLYENDGESDRQLQHLARASVAAAQAGNRREFARTFQMLAGQDPDDERADKAGKKPAAGPKPPAAAARAVAQKATRRVRSANWQRALLVVARDALPALVEHDDQPDLSTLVQTLQRHLNEAGRGPVDEELTTLYRAASAHLKSGARAYAETVGAERRPILLGDVLIGRKYAVPAPQIDLSSALDEIGPMVFVPRRGNDASAKSLQRWPGRLGVAWTGSRS
jgi:hypothetical protein